MDASDSPRRLMAIGRRKPTDREIIAHDRHVIVAHDHCTIVANDHRVIDGPRSSCDHGHQSAVH